MRLKVIHLYNYLEKIDRDISELEVFYDTLQKDRTYSEQVLLSLEQERHKLKKLKETLLNQIIESSPLSLITDFDTSKTTQKDELTPIENSIKPEGPIWEERAKQNITFSNPTNTMKQNPKEKVETTSLSRPEIIPKSNTTKSSYNEIPKKVEELKTKKENPSPFKFIFKD